MTWELFHSVELEWNLNITEDIYIEDRYDQQKHTCYSVYGKKLSNLIIIDMAKETILSEERIYFSQLFYIPFSYALYMWYTHHHIKYVKPRTIIIIYLKNLKCLFCRWVHFSWHGEDSNLFSR